MNIIPEYLQECIKPDTRAPNPDRMSVTQLFDSPLIRTLWLENWDKIEQEPEDMLWMLYGTALDTIVKRYNRTGLTDIKLEYQMDDYLIVGKPDIFYPTTRTLVDLKTTSVWNLKEPKRDWVYQLNSYKYLMSKLYPQLEVEKLQIHGIGRDWRRNEKLRYNDYPDSAFVVLNIPVMDNIEDEINKALQRHKDFPRAECTDEEKWRKSTTYAVMKKGRKSAVRVLDTRKEAMDYCKEKKIVLNNTNYIVERPGDCVRCNQYCNLKSFCPYMKGK